MWNEFWGWLASLPPGSASFVGTLAGSSFGLLAILAGALVNAHLNRKRDDVQRDHERVALASALYAEFKGVHRSFTENAEHLKSKPLDGEGGFFVPQPSTDLTPELLPKLDCSTQKRSEKLWTPILLRAVICRDWSFWAAGCKGVCLEIANRSI
jgi:hypothetical protein